jgi:hypothetical protein
MPDGGEPARLLAALGAPRPLPADAVARIEQRVVERTGARSAPLRGLRWWAVVSLGVAGVAGATTVATRNFVMPVIERLSSDRAKRDEDEARSRRRARPPRLALSAASEAPPAEGRPAESRPSIVPLEAPASPEPPPPPEHVPAPAAARDRRRVEQRRVRAAAVPAPAASVPSAAPASTLAEESVLLEGALRRLRRDRDGAGALVVLDGYRSRFPSGELSHEAERTRVEALLLLGRSRPALQVLDAMSFGASSRDLQLHLVRGELRAEAGRCAEAEGDFADVLGRAGGSEGAARALYGRASCRSRRGDQSGARADLEAYLARFPTGRHASEVRKALAGAR